MLELDMKAVHAFLSVWAPEFEKAVEMVTGHLVKIERPDHADTEENAASQDNSIVWQGQVLEREGVGSVWVGILPEACVALTQTSESDLKGDQTLYQELLQQSFEGSAHVLSGGRTPRLVCRQTLAGKTPAGLAAIETAWVTTGGGKRFPVFVGIESAFSALLQSPDAHATTLRGESAPWIERLADLELPISVILGRVRMPIREVLKLTAGSLVEMDRRVGDMVELVVHNSVVARGEVVSVGGSYGVSIREIISRSDRAALQASVQTRPTRPSNSTRLN